MDSTGNLSHVLARFLRAASSELRAHEKGTDPFVQALDSVEAVAEALDRITLDAAEPSAASASPVLPLLARPADACTP